MLIIDFIVLFCTMIGGGFYAALLVLSLLFCAWSFASGWLCVLSDRYLFVTPTDLSRLVARVILCVFLSCSQSPFMSFSVICVSLMLLLVLAAMSVLLLVDFSLVNLLGASMWGAICFTSFSFNFLK